LDALFVWFVWSFIRPQTDKTAPAAAQAALFKEAAAQAALFKEAG
jgi:hypothetical protein